VYCSSEVSAFPENLPRLHTVQEATPSSDLRHLDVQTYIISHSHWTAAAHAFALLI